MNEGAEIKGSIPRAAMMLSVLSKTLDGASLGQIAAVTGFSKTTCHRVLASLLDVRYVFQDPSTRRYHLGGGLAALSREAGRSDLSSLAERHMRRLADVTADTVFLSAREGAASVCVRRETGAFPIRTLSLNVGDRLPLGVGATGQALYAATPPEQRRAAAMANRGWLAEYRSSPSEVERLAQDFETRGYAFNPSLVVPGMSAIALPVMAPSGRLIAALGVGAINERMTAERREGEALPALRAEVARLEERMEILEREGLI